MINWFLKADLQKVRATMNGLAVEIKKTRKQIKKARKEYKNNLRYTAYFIADEYRHYSLIYGFGRGKKYSDLEKFCTDKPNVEFLLEILNRYGHLYSSIVKWTPGCSHETRDSDMKLKLISWLKGENSNA